MKRNSWPLSGFCNPRMLVGVALCVAALMLGFFAFVVKAAPAVTITVNSLASSATAGDGACTLREAINNFNAQADTSGGDCASGAGETLISFGLSGTIPTGGLIISDSHGVTI